MNHNTNKVYLNFCTLLRFYDLRFIFYYLFIYLLTYLLIFCLTIPQTLYKQKLSQYLCTYCSLLLDSLSLCIYVHDTCPQCFSGLYSNYTFSQRSSPNLKLQSLPIISHALSVPSYILHAYHSLIVHLFYFCMFFLFVSPTRI